MIRRVGVVVAAGGSMLSAPAIGYLALLTGVGFGTARRRRPMPSDTPTTTITVIVPAHDEAAGIADTLRSLASVEYPDHLRSCHVVADNCTDATADVVRSHGVEVHERSDPEHPGKGPALNWTVERLAADDRLGDVVVIVDADTSIDPGFHRAVDAWFRSPSRSSVAQGYYAVRDPEASPVTSFRHAALACRHHLRPTARRRLGGSCGLYGNGMVFTAALMQDRRWSDHLVEDAELQLDLLLDGIIVDYLPDAVVAAEMPETTEQAASQQQRWERGRIDLVRRFLPPLAAAWRRRPEQRAALSDAIADQLVPPLSVLAASQIVLAGLAAPAALSGRSDGRRAIVAPILGVGVVSIHAIAGLASIRADAVHYRMLLRAPRLVASKCVLWARSAMGLDDVAWQRTTRRSEL